MLNKRALTAAAMTLGFSAFIAAPSAACAIQLTGISGYQYRDSLATNIHIDRTDGQWGNYDFLEQALRSTGYPRVRSVLSFNRVANMRNFMQRIDANDGPTAIRSIMVVNRDYTSAQQIINDVNVWGIDALELPNEINQQTPQWIAESKRLAPIVAQAAKTFGMRVIAPALVDSDPAQIASIAPYVTDVNQHIYGNREPETKGWGPDVYGNGTAYGSFPWNIATANRLGSGKNFFSTERGYSTAPGQMSKATQASYLARATLQCALARARCAQYDLLDESGTGDGAWGLFEANGKPKPSARALQLQNAVLSDTTASTTPCVADLTMQTDQDVDISAVCHGPGPRQGEIDVTLVRPVQLQDPDTKAAIPVVPAHVKLSMPNPGTTRLYTLDADYIPYVSTPTALPTILVTERMTFVAFRASIPVGLTPLPSP